MVHHLTCAYSARDVSHGSFASLDGLPSQGVHSAGSIERIVINDNRTAAGTTADGVRAIRLEARLGTWHPDRDSDPGVVVKAFAVEGGPLQIPGPLIRVREGTEIRIRIRNTLGDSLALHGFYTRPGTELSSEAVTIAPNEAREIAFAAGRPGTYYYWGATSADTRLQQRSPRDSQLVGALIVDPRDAPTEDRVLLISNWSTGPGAGTFGRMVINGRSWPHTERLTYKVGETVRMRVINAGAAVHPMHLHGFYFNVDRRGDEHADTVFPRGLSARMVVTERLPGGRTFSLTWKPTRPGNWLFHCHDNVHLQRGIPLDGGPAPAPHAHVENHALEMMSGPVMGITLTGKSIEPRVSTTVRRRQLRLVARIDRDGTAQEPSYGYTLHTGSATDAPPPPYLPGPTIVLQRSEPVSIIVKNELPEPTSVHWHGIELESYYDGVAGFAGEGRRIAPAIPSGGSFEARFTPPRAGTFIYHTHIDEVRQQQAGLSGALLVVDDPAGYDPQRDIVLLATVPRKAADAAKVLLNGSSTPPLREMRLGEHYRLRLINIHTFRPAMRLRLLRDATLLEWRALAKDGMNLPPDQAIMGPSEIQMGNGETYDFEFVPSAAGELRFDVTSAAGVLLVSMQIRVRSPERARQTFASRSNRRSESERITSSEAPPQTLPDSASLHHKLDNAPLTRGRS
jgi:FtsP/CotA-like multicopper oxidase with cupredoxin domain